MEGLDLLLIVVEAGMRSVETAKRILGMVPQLGIRNVKVVANKVRPSDFAVLSRRLATEGLSADIVLGYSEELAARDLEGKPVFDYTDGKFTEGTREILGGLAKNFP